MIELLLVVVVVALLMAIAMPKFTVVRDQSSARAARLQLASAFSTARAAAVQKGQPSTLTIIDGTVVQVTVLSGLNRQRVKVLGPMRFDASTGVEMTSLDGVTEVRYDPRGMITPALAEMVRFKLSAGSASDTLCISASGLIMQRDCRL